MYGSRIRQENAYNVRQVEGCSRMASCQSYNQISAQLKQGMNAGGILDVLTVVDCC